MSREGRGVIEDIVSSLLDSARFVNDNLGSVVEFVFVSVALLAVLAVVFVFIPVIGVFLISSEKSAMGLVTSLEALPVLTAAVFSVLFYTYQTVYYHSLKSS